MPHLYSIAWRVVLANLTPYEGCDEIVATDPVQARQSFIQRYGWLGYHITRIQLVH